MNPGRAVFRLTSPLLPASALCSKVVSFPSENILSEETLVSENKFVSSPFDGVHRDKIIRLDLIIAGEACFPVLPPQPSSCNVDFVRD
jgi:hypothetical protein